MSKLKLFDYQKKAIEFFKEKKKVILGLDMGLGKSLTSIEATKDMNRVLVICPSSLKFNYASEMDKFYGDKITYVVSTGTKKQRLNQIEAYFNLNAQYLIINYEMLRTKGYEFLFKTKWDCVIFDESHKLGNRKSQIGKIAKKLKTEYICMLTGTPIYTKVDQLFNQLQTLDRKNFRSYWQFVMLYCETDYNPFSQSMYGTPNGKVKDKEHLLRELEPYLLRYKKEDVLDLPPKLYENILIEMPDKVKKEYKRIKKEKILGEKFLTTPMEVLYALKYLLLEPKLIDSDLKSPKEEVLLNTIDNVENQMIVFSYSKKYIKVLQTMLSKKGYDCQSFHGDISVDDRNKTIKDFQSGKFKILLATIQAGGTGLNLQNASTIIFTDKSYCPSENLQAEDRIHRANTTHTCNIISLIMKDSIEEQIEALLEQRKDDIDSVVNSDILRRLTE